MYKILSIRCREYLLHLNHLTKTNVWMVLVVELHLYVQAFPSEMKHQLHQTWPCTIEISIIELILQDRWQTQLFGSDQIILWLGKCVPKRCKCYLNMAHEYLIINKHLNFLFIMNILQIGEKIKLIWCLRIKYTSYSVFTLTHLPLSHISYYPFDPF